MAGLTRTQCGIALLTAALVSACAGYPVPLSAQAGSTIVVPLASGNDVVVGYGGLVYTDHQRGTMVYQLDGPGGFELVTRFSIAAEHHAASRLAMRNLFGNIAYPPQILSVVDIPEDAPEGTHSLHVVRRLPDGTEFEGPAYALQPGFEFAILPHSIAVNGGAETVEGRPTPAAKSNHAWGAPCTNSCGFAHLVDEAVPQPRIRVSLQGNAEGDNIGAFEMELSYPAGVIDIADAFETREIYRAANNRGTIFIMDDGVAGVVQVSGVAHPDALVWPGSMRFWSLEVVFELDNGASQILDLADVTVSSFTAYDLDGNPLPGATASVTGIR